MEYNKITEIIIGCAIEVHRELGPGMLENVYKECLAYELREHGLEVKCEVPVPVIYKEITLNCGYRIDMLIEDKIILELKSVETLNSVHEAQILTYMRFSEKPIGLLINFNTKLLKHGIKRYIL